VPFSFASERRSELLFLPQKKNAGHAGCFVVLSRDPDWIRTNGRKFRKLVLYPAELRDRVK
jgi:hypothetical protein